MTILQHKPPQTASKIKETLCIFGILAGTAFTAISQQAALTSIPLLGLLMMQRTNQHRLTLAQQQQRQRIITEIQHLETQIHTTESSSEHYLTKTHLTPIIAKLHQLQRENKVFKLKALKDVTQHINTLEHQLDHLTHQTQNLQACQHNLEQQFQHHSSQIQPYRHLKPIPTKPDNNRVAIERIQQLSRRVEVVGYRATTSQKLMRLADNYLDLETQTCLSRVA